MVGGVSAAGPSSGSTTTVPSHLVEGVTGWAGSDASQGVGGSHAPGSPDVRFPGVEDVDAMVEDDDCGCNGAPSNQQAAERTSALLQEEAAAVGQGIPPPPALPPGQSGLPIKRAPSVQLQHEVRPRPCPAAAHHFCTCTSPCVSPCLSRPPVPCRHGRACRGVWTRRRCQVQRTPRSTSRTTAIGRLLSRWALTRGAARGL
mmetsp:Transcript_41956/g.102388  ORF Transcript_41956/g.102388 Transcript_41956/m.102388 type:complete len:202 (-) Transcript_41956:782-1387(-)